MTNEDKQAVVDDTKVVAEPTTAVESARDDGLDALLAEFDQKTQPVSPPEVKADKPQEPIVPERIRALEQRLFQEDINKTASEIFDGIKVPQRVQVGWLEQIAREKPRVGLAWTNRFSDPVTWSKVAKVLQREAKQDFVSDIDQEVTADVNAVAAAMRGASAKITAEPPPKFGHMSDNELREYTRKNFGFV